MSVSEHQHGYIQRKDDYLKRLRRIEGLGNVGVESGGDRQRLRGVDHHLREPRRRLLRRAFLARQSRRAH